MDELDDTNSTLITVSVRVAGERTESGAEETLAEALDYANYRLDNTNIQVVS